MKRVLISTAATLVVMPFMVAGAAAQTAGATPPIASIQEFLREIATPSYRFPSIFGVASAVGGEGSAGFASLTYANPRGGVPGNDADGDMALGYSFGSASAGVSVTAGLAITSLDGFGDSGSLFFSASRQVYSGNGMSTFIGAAVNNVAAYGDAADSDESYTVSVSHLLQAGEVPMQMTLGYGDTTTYDDDGSGDLGEGVFFGIGAGISQNMSISMSGTETQLNVGVGFGIPQIEGLNVSAGVFDVLDNVDRQQFSLTIAYSF